MKNHLPPEWLERTLLLFLDGRDRESISGDLLEEYREERLPKSGRLRANVWYLRQCASFASVRLCGGGLVKRLLALLCVFVAAACAWLVMMEFVLKHPGYMARSAVELCLCAQAIVTLLYLLLHAGNVLRRVALMCAMLIVPFGAYCLVEILRAQHFEGYILLISAALMMQGALTMAVLLRRPADKTA